MAKFILETLSILNFLPHFLKSVFSPKCQITFPLVFKGIAKIRLTGPCKQVFINIFLRKITHFFILLRK